jgi:hypothetical protein
MTTTRLLEAVAAPPDALVQIHEDTDPQLVIPSSADGKHIVEVSIIQSGISKNGLSYSPQLLHQAAPLFEGARAFVDHGPDPRRSMRDLAGYYRNARFAGGAIRAELHLVPGNDWLWHLIEAAQENASLFGLSIDALGDVDADSSPMTVNSIAQVHSVDIVSRPAAGGTVGRILQSEGNPMAISPPPAAPEQAPPPPADKTPVQLQEDELRSLRSTMEAEVAEMKRLHEEELAASRQLAAGEILLATALRDSKLPEIFTEKLHRRFSGKPFEEAHLQEAIADEQKVLAQFSDAGKVTGHGFEKGITVGLSEYDQLQGAFDALFDIHESDASKSIPRLSGIREAFVIATGADIQRSGPDAPLREEYARGLRDKVRAGRLQEAEAHLQEADVTTASFSFLLGTSMNKRLLKDYQAWPSEWQKFSTITAIKDFKQQDRVRLGNFGSLSTVAEDAAYTTLTVTDVRAIYTPTKRGNLVQITRETIVNDDLYAIRQIPQKLAVAAAYTLAEFVYGLLAPSGAVIYDANKLFDTVNHLNTGVTVVNLPTPNSGAALSSAALQAAIIKMRKQANIAGKIIGLKPRFLLVPPDLEFVAMTLLKSAGLPGGNNNDINPMMGYAEPIVVPQLNLLNGVASTTVWMAVADPRVIDTLEVGFVGGQQNPVLLIQDMPLYGLNFTQDVITYKVRHEYGGAVVDYRGFYLGNN